MKSRNQKTVFYPEPQFSKASSLRLQVLKKLGYWLISVLVISASLVIWISIQWYIDDRARAVDRLITQAEPHLARAAWQVNNVAVDDALRTMLGKNQIIQLKFNEKFTSTVVSSPDFEAGSCKSMANYPIEFSGGGAKIQAELFVCRRALNKMEILRFAAITSLPFAGLGLVLSILLYLVLDKMVVSPINMVSSALRKGDNFLEFELERNLGQSNDIDVLISAIKSKSRQLMAERDFATTWFYGSNDGMLILDEVGEVIRYNDAANLIFDGLPAGKWKLGHLDHEFAKNRNMSISAPIVSHNNGKKYVVNCTLITSLNRNDISLVTARDVTAQYEAERERNQREKLNAIGQLAVGIAHDFNNILAVALSTIEVLKGNDRLTDIEEELINDAVKALESGSGITHQLTAFSRKSVVRSQLVDVEELIQSTISLFARGTLKGVHFQTDVSFSGILITSPELLMSALINILDNAREASDPGSTIWLRCSTTSRGDQQFARFTVEDSGSGIPAENLEHVMDPFFTTKPKKKGSGLGLSSAKSFAQSWGGMLEISSEVGKGTIIDIFLPLKEEAASEKRVGSTSPNKNGDVPKKILMIDDNIVFQRVTALQLEALGNEVDIANSFDEVVELADRRNDWDLVLCDVNLGAKHGANVFEELRRQGAQAHFVFMSAGLTQEDIDKLDAIGSNHKIRKPFKVEEFLELAQVIGTVSRPRFRTHSQ